MWTKQMSLRLSRACVLAFFVALWAGTVVCTIGMGDILRYAGSVYDTPGMLATCVTLLYISAVTGTAVLICLHFLLQNIAAGQVFVPSNIRLLRLLSWLCFCVAGIFLAAVLAQVHIIFLLAAAAVAFIGLLLRVVKNAFAEAVELKNENDLTV